MATNRSHTTERKSAQDAITAPRLTGDARCLPATAKAAGFPPQDQDYARDSRRGRYRPACATGRQTRPTTRPWGPSTSSNTPANARVRCR